MSGDMSALVLLHVTGKYGTKHEVRMLQACGLGSSQAMSLKPSTLIPHSRSLNTKSRILNPKPYTLTPIPHPETLNPES